MFAKIFELIAAFKAKNWKVCVRVMGEILVAGSEFIPGPAVVTSESVLTDDGLIAKLEASCPQGTEVTAEAFPWGALWPVLSEIFKRILDRIGGA